MSTRINLLPDIRQAKQADAGRRHLASLAGVMAVVVGGGILTLLVIITQAQNLRIHQLSSDITKKQTTLAGDKDLAAALTVQKQLQQLSGLYKDRVYASQFLIQLAAIMPPNSSVTAVATSPASGAVPSLTTISISAIDMPTADKLVQSLAASHTKTGPNASETKTPDFTKVTVSSFTVDDKGRVTFSLTTTIDKGLYNHER